MNGKNRRVRGCWSRATPRGKAYLTKPPQHKHPKPPQISYTLPIFSQELKNQFSLQTHTTLTQYFESYPYLRKIESYRFDANTVGAIVLLYQHHFNGGTVRITKPGIYILQESITFHPNADHDFFPTPAQIMSNQYPMGSQGAYHLGFFAAITVETGGVILDLNGKTLQQSKLHNLQQRFYANIELASAPFIPAQGPATFSTESTYKLASNTLILNGYLGLSSHHGIHGNTAHHIFLHNLSISDFEVAAIALNGAHSTVLNNITIHNVSQHIPILSTYSQSRFIRTFLKTLQTNVNGATLGAKNIDTIIADLDSALEDAKNDVMDNKIPTNFFGNQTLLYDGNVYGVVLNVNGVVVNDFLTERGDGIGNEDIHLQNINIHNIVSHPVEIIALNAPPEEEQAYGGKRMVGPIGDVLTIEHVTNNEKKYAGTPLSNAQLILAKYKDSISVGTTNIVSEVVTWAEQNTSIDTLVVPPYYYVGGGDSMGHFMKGNIGLFISGARNITGHKITVSNVETKGTLVGNSPLILQEDQNKQGAMSTGILFTGADSVTLTNTTVGNIASNDGLAYDTHNISSTNITITE